MKNYKMKSLLIALAICLVSSTVLAYGPFYVYPPTTGGQSYKWPNNTMRWMYDDGPKLSATIPLHPKSGQESFCETADHCSSAMIQCGVLKCVEKELQEWQTASLLTRTKDGDIEDIPTTNLSIVNAGPVSAGVDITKDNYPEFKQKAFNENIGLVIFDVDGSIIEIEAGKGQKFLLGLTLLSRGVGSPYYTGGVVIFNGLVVDGINTVGNPELPDGPKGFSGTILHELGHLLGLDHSLPRKAILGATVDSLPTTPEGVPTMYPKLITIDQTDLHIDDIAGISSLYPSYGFDTKFCTIKGELKNGATGVPIQGVNVIAYADVVSGAGADEKACDARSNVSGVMYAAGQPNGQYVLGGIVPGVPYRVVYEAVLSDFQGFTGGLNPYGTDVNPGFTGPTEDELQNISNSISAGSGAYSIVGCDISNDGTPELLTNFAEDLGTQQAYVTSSMIINMDSADISVNESDDNDDTTTDKKKGWCMSVAGGIYPAWGLIIPAVVGIISLARRKYKA